MQNSQTFPNGQIVSALRRQLTWTQDRQEQENAPIGMIICRSKNKTVVEYALRTASRLIGVATYEIVPQLPEAYRAELPSPEAIVERLKLWDGKGENEA